MWTAAQAIARAATTAIGAVGTTLLLSDGDAAGQEVNHAHLHVVPRYDSADLTFTVEAWRTPAPQHDALAATSDVLARAIA